jgi:hypothetical protein
MELLGRRRNYCGRAYRLALSKGRAQEGHYGAGHDRWHQDFYSEPNRNDGRGPCCSLTDCRPTQSRMVGDHYEVKVDGEWIPVPRMDTGSQ